MGSASAVQLAVLIEQRSGRDSDAELHRRLDAVLLHIKAGARELAVVLLRSNHEYGGAGHQEAALARGVSEDWGGRVNGVFRFSALVADFDNVALRRPYRSSHDSSLEEAGFERSVPLWFGPLR